MHGLGNTLQPVQISSWSNVLLKRICWMTEPIASTAWPRRHSSVKVVVAGHLCLDLTPDLFDKKLPTGGGLLMSGSLAISPGGAVPNVGLALIRLGELVRLVGRTGDDAVAALLRSALSIAGEQSSLCPVQGKRTSYSIVIAQRGMDRFFIHCPGANETFTSDVVRDEDLANGRWLHFGYPPLMPAMCENDGKELELLFTRACDGGLRTSLDFCSIDPYAKDSFKWDLILSKCGPKVMVFAPGLEEISDALDIPGSPDMLWSSISDISSRLLALGFAIVVLKLGNRGLYLRSTDSAARVAAWDLGSKWTGRELFISCFEATLINANGAGDCTIAGLITALTQNFTPEQTLTFAAAVGACSVEASDASTGVMGLDATIDRIEAGWIRKAAVPPSPAWQYDESAQLWKGPHEHRLYDLRFSEEITHG
jgi:sugar/nucleoside kinase (ribokinase family)